MPPLPGSIICGRRRTRRSWPGTGHSARSAAERAGIARWGYPYVFATWFFHMTLSRRLSEAEHALWRPRAEAHFAAALALPRRVGDLCLFVQPAPDEPFVIAERLPLAG